MFTAFWIAFTTTIVIGTVIVVIGWLIGGIADDHEAVKQGYRSVHDREFKQLEVEHSDLATGWYKAAVARFKASGELPADWNGPVPARCANMIHHDPSHVARDFSWWDNTPEEALLYTAMSAERQQEYDRRHAS